MTVKELIEHLQKQDQNLPVAICTDDFYGNYSVIEAADVMPDKIRGNSHNNRERFDAMVIRIY